MSDGVLSLRDLSQPHSVQRDSNPPEVIENPERSGNLLSSSNGRLELELTDGGTPIAGGALVGVQTGRTICVGLVESGETLANSQRLKVRIDHWLDPEDVSSIQKLWNQEQAD